MEKKKKSPFKVTLYDPGTGRRINLESLIERLGIQAVARRYRVTESAVRKWRKGARHPGLKTVSKSVRGLFE